MDGCLDWVAKDTPLAVVDDQLCAEDALFLEKLFCLREAPTLVISPDPAVGLGGALVEILCDFAAFPGKARFEGRFVWVIYAIRMSGGCLAGMPIRMAGRQGGPGDVGLRPARKAISCIAMQIFPLWMTGTFAGGNRDNAGGTQAG